MKHFFLFFLNEICGAIFLAAALQVTTDVLKEDITENSSSYYPCVCCGGGGRR